MSRAQGKGDEAKGWSKTTATKSSGAARKATSRFAKPKRITSTQTRPLPSKFEVGDEVEDTFGIYRGVVAFVGPTKFKKGIWIGLILADTCSGTNNGSVKGVSYFKCNAKQGKFVELERVKMKSQRNPKSIERASQSSIDLVIHEHPQAPESILYGTSVKIYIKATGPGILSYQWIKDKEPITGKKVHGCSGMKTDTLVIESLQPEHCGEYSCKVSSQDGRDNHKTSSIITLKGRDPIIVYGHPECQTKPYGSDVHLSVKAEGPILSYQWEKDGENIEVDELNGYSGATTPDLYISSLSPEHEGSYICIVSNDFDIVNTNSANVKGREPLLINDHPETKTMVLGQEVTFVVSATGPGTLSYNWMKDGEEITDNHPLNFVDFDTPTLRITSFSQDNEGSYKCIVKNDFDRLESNAANLKALVIKEDPQSQYSLYEGTVTFCVSAVGSDSLNYQWTKDGEVIIDGSLPHCDGANSDTLCIRFFKPEHEGYYQCTVGCNDGCSVQSSCAQLKGREPLKFSVHPKDQYKTYGSEVVFSVSASGAGTIAYQWIKDDMDIVEGVVPEYIGIKAPNLSISSLSQQHEGQYCCKIINEDDCKVSFPAQLKGREPIVICDYPKSQTTIYKNEVSLAVVATGPGPLFYQWKKNGEPLIYFNAPEIYISSFTSTDEGSYTCLITNDNDKEETPPAILKGKEPLKLHEQPQSQHKVFGTKVTFSVSATGAGPISYKWMKDERAIELKSDSGFHVKDSTLLIFPFAKEHEGNYMCMVTNEDRELRTDIATLRGRKPLKISETPRVMKMLLGENVTLTITVTGPGHIKYQWYKKNSNDGNYSKCIGQGSQTSSLCFNSFSEEHIGDYRCVVSNEYDEMKSDIICLKNKVLPAISQQPKDEWRFYRDKVTLSVAASEALSYKWLKDGEHINSDNLQNITGLDTPSLHIECLSSEHNGNYRCEVSNEDGMVKSDYVRVQGSDRIMISEQPMSQMVAPRDEVSLSIFATGAGILYYKWLKDGEEIAVHKNFNIHGVNRRILCIRHFLPQHEGSYKCVVSNKHGKVDSVSVLVKCLKIIEHPESKVYICGEDTFLKVVVSEEIAEKATLTYQWFKDDEYIKELPNCSGTDTPTLVITSLLPEHHGKYKCVIKDEDASMESKSATLFNSDNLQTLQNHETSDANTNEGLTVENVVHHIKSVSSRWKELGKALLSEALMNQIHSLILSDDKGLRAVIHAWLHDDGKEWNDNYLSYYKTWRHLLEVLDGMGEMELVDELSDFAEPLKDELLTAENIIAVMSAVDHNKRKELWTRIMAGVSKKRLEVIESSHPDETKQVEAFATYYIKLYSNSAWHLLYRALYNAGETIAMDKVLQIDSNRKAFSRMDNEECSTFTVDNVAAIMNVWAKSNWIEYFDAGGDEACLIPSSKIKAVQAMQQRSMDWCFQEFAGYFITYHPKASWLYLASKMYLRGANSTALEMINQYLETKEASIDAENLGAVANEIDPEDWNDMFYHDLNVPNEKYFELKAIYKCVKQRMDATVNSYTECPTKSWKAITAALRKRGYDRLAKEVEALYIRQESPEITKQPKSKLKVVYGNEISLCVCASGPGTLFYQWMKDGEPVVDKTFNCTGIDIDRLHINYFMPQYTGRYSCIVRNENGEVISDTCEVIDDSPLKAQHHEGYICAACNIQALVYLSNKSTERIRIEAVDRITSQSNLKVSDIVLSPVIRISPLDIAFHEHPAIVEMMKTVEFKLPQKNRCIFPLFSDSDRSSAPDWKELLSNNNCCEVSNDRTIFKTTHTGLFTVVARLPSAYNSITVKPEDVDTVELTVSELPGFKVEIPPKSVNSSTEIGATIHFDGHELNSDFNGQALASVGVELEPQNFQLNNPVPLTIPIPEYDKIRGKYPEAQLQVWHTPNKEEPNKWKFLQACDVHPNDHGNHEATFHTSTLATYGYAWNIKQNDELDSIVTRSISSLIVEAEVQTIKGRCQVFMSSEQNVDSQKCFSISAIVYPFQEPYEGLLNYSSSLFDSGHIPIGFEVGILHYTLKFEDHLFPNDDIDSKHTKVLSKSAKLSQQYAARADFPVRLNGSAELNSGMMIAQLLISRGLGKTPQHEYDLIMPRENLTTKHVLANLSGDEEDIITIELPYGTFQHTEQLKLNPHLSKLLHHLWPARSRWRYIGIALGLPIGTLDAIKENNHYMCDPSFTDLLQVWLQQPNAEGPPPSWSELINAMNARSVRVKLVEFTEIKIKQQPQEQINKSNGENVTFTVEAYYNGPGELDYQWKRNKISITDDKYSNCKGANKSSFHITNLSKQFEGKYCCLISSKCGDKTESTSAELVVRNRLKITKHPQSQCKHYGEKINLNIFVDGEGTLCYQWIKDGKPLSEEIIPNCFGCDSSELEITSFSSEHEGSYRCIVRNKDNEQESNDAHLHVLKIIEQPKSQHELYESEVVLVVAASGPGTLSYQWIKDGDDITDTTLPDTTGTNTPTLQINCLSPKHDGKYTCVISYGDECMVASEVATLKGREPLKIKQHPLTQCKLYQEEVTFSVIANGAGTLKYRWKKDNKYIEINTSDYNGIDSDTLYIPSFNKEHKGRYTCVIENEDRSLESNFADLAVLEIIEQPKNQNEFYESEVVLVVAASGPGTLSYQWMKDGDNITDTTLPDTTGTNTPTLQINCLSPKHDGKYTCVIGYCEECMLESETATLKGREPLKIKEHPLTQCKLYQEEVTFSVVATGAGTLKYRWKKDNKTIEINTSGYDGIDTDTLYIPLLNKEHKGRYTCIIENEDRILESNFADLAVLEIIEQPKNQNELYESEVVLVVTASGPGTLSYQWAKDGDDITDTTLPDTTGTNTPTLQINCLSPKHDGKYTCIISYGEECMLESEVATLKGREPLKIKQHPLTQCKLFQKEVTFSVVATGAGTLKYRWKKDNKNIEINTSDYNGTDSDTLFISSFNKEHKGRYTCVIENEDRILESNFADLAVLEIIKQPKSQNELYESEVVLVVTASGPGTLSYQWIKDGDDITDTTLPDTTGTNTPTLQINCLSPKHDGKYMCVISYGEECMLESEVATLKGREPLKIKQHPLTQCKLYQEEVTFSVVATGAGTLKYRWKKDNKNIEINTSDYSGVDSDTLYIPSFDKEHKGRYTCVIENEDRILESNFADLAVLEITEQPKSQNELYENKVVLVVAASGPGTLSYQWTKDGDDITDTTLPDTTGTNTRTLQINCLSPKHDGKYSCVVSYDEDCTLQSETATLKGREPLKIKQHPLTQCKLYQEEVTFNVVANGAGALKYRWKKDNKNIAINTSGYNGIDTDTLYIPSFNEEHKGRYTCVVENEDRILESNFADLAALTIKTQPESQTKVYGRNITLSMSATGPGILSYKWMKNGYAIEDNNVTGINDPVLYINNFSKEHDGEYTCVVSNEHCTLMSNPGRLKGREPLKFVCHPQTQCKTHGDKVQLTVSATGAGTISYQWIKDNEAINSDKDAMYSGVNSKALLINSFVPARHKGEYLCKVSNEDSTLISESAQLQALEILEDPKAQCMIYETEVILRVSALGPGMMSYQWIKDGRVITKSNLPSITGEDSATLYINKFSHAHDGEYHCIVSNESCMLVTECAIIQGREPLLLHEHPQTQCKIFGEEALFAVSATGAGTISYQWIKDNEAIKSDGTTTYAGISTDTLCINSFTSEHKGEYCCKVSNDDSSIISDVASLQALEIIEQYPENQNIIYENEVTVTVSAIGPGTISYLWIKDGEEITSNSLPYCSGFNTPHLQLNYFSPEHDGKYLCMVSNEHCQLKSRPGQLQGRKPLKLHKHPQTQCKVYHDTVTFTVSATGAGTISYQWMKDKEVIQSDEYSGVNTDSLCISSFTSGHKGEYCCQISNEDSSITSNAAELQALEIIEELPESRNEIYENEVTLTVTATGPGSISYQWNKDGEEITGNRLPYCSGFNSPHLQLTCFSPEHDGKYLCIVSNDYCQLKSKPGQLQGRKPLKLHKHPQTQCKVYHVTVTFTVSATGAGTISYQWMKDKEVIQSDEYSGVNTDSLCISSFTSGHKGEYCCQISNEDSSITSNVAKLQALEIIEQLPESQNKIYETEVTLMVTATGPGTISYQWMKDEEKITGHNLPNCSGFATPSLHLSYFSPEHDGQYVCIIKNEYCTLKSLPGQLKGREPLKISSHPQTQCKLFGDEVFLTVHASGAGIISYHWIKDEKAIEDDQFPTFTGIRSSKLCISSFMPECEGKYWCKVTNEDSALMSHSAELKALSFIKHPETQEKLYESDVTFTAIATGFGNLSYQWMKDGVVMNEDTLPHCTGVHTTTLYISCLSALHDGYYTCTVSNEEHQLKSNPAQLQGREPLKINTQPIEQEVFYTQEVALSVSATGAGTIMYEWMKDGSSIATLESTDFTAADSPILRISHFSKKHEGKYSCVVRNQDNTLDSHTVNLRGKAPLQILKPKPKSNSQDTQTVYYETQKTLTVEATGLEPLTYQWIKEKEPLKNSPDYCGVNTNTLHIIPFMTRNHEGTYTCKVSNSTGTRTSPTIKLIGHTAWQTKMPKHIPFQSDKSGRDKLHFCDKETFVRIAWQERRK